MTRIRSTCFAALAVLLLPVAGHADLIEADDDAYGADSLTQDTSSGLEWLDLTQSLGYSVNDILGGAGGFIAAGFSIATTAQVEALWMAAGWDGVDDSGNAAGTAAHDAPAALLLSLLGQTGVGSDGPFGEGWALPATNTGLVARPFFTDLNSPHLGNGRFACSQAGFDTFTTPVNSFSSCRMDRDQSYGFIGAYLVRRTAAVPEPGTLVLLGLGLAGLGFARRRKA